MIRIRRLTKAYPGGTRALQTYLGMLNDPAASTVLPVRVALVMLVDLSSSKRRARLV